MTAQPPAISTLAPLTPPVLERLVQRCLAKDPDDRWQSARDLKAELDWLSSGSGLQASPVVSRSGAPDSKTHWILLDSGCRSGDYLCVAVGWVHWTEKPQPGAPGAGSRSLLQAGEKFLGISPPGSHLLTARRFCLEHVTPQPSARPRLWIYRVSTGEATPFRDLRQTDNWGGWYSRTVPR